MGKKFVILVSIMLVSFVFIIPSHASPSDGVLDQQVELAVPGRFELINTNHDRKAEGIQFTLDMQAYQPGQYIINGNLEGMKDGEWQSLGTTVVSLDWTPDKNQIMLFFHGGLIRQMQVSGPYRVSVSLKNGDWQLPTQIVGFSPKYSWNTFDPEERADNGEIATPAMAKQAAETWAGYNSIRLGKLLGISYNYDKWQVEFKASNKILRFLISPQGEVKLLKINNPDSYAS